MKSTSINPRKTLNKAFLKVKPNRTQIEGFKANLIKLIDNINESESEEHHKNLVSDFLKNTYYKENYFINTKGRNDLVIHNGKDAKSTVGVIIEAKKPTNKSEMPKVDNVNSKAFQELVLYYMRERITLKNLEVKYLVATNILEWFIFDATLFEKEFAQNKTLVNQFNEFTEGRLSGKTTDFFYKEIAEPAILNIKSDIEFAYFNIREYEKPLRNDDKKDDNKLIALFKLLSPEHLLKLPFVNDSNSLDKSFYAELLNIIGLSETKDGSKKLIGRKPEGDRNSGSLIENTISILKAEDCLSQLKASNFGSNKDEQLYTVALELVITWINRILFLKLLEGQLIKYHKGDATYRFLNYEQIPDYDALNKLFFQVLAVKENERNDLVKTKYKRIPYLNSSLFEPAELEHKTIRISNLEDEYKMPLLNATALKDNTGKRLKGELNALEYLFSFLDAYDFASEGSEEIQEDNKALINASVLGLIFEKINGYKDGSFFTPGFITMYMARETIRRAVVQKFNEIKGWSCNEFVEIYDKIENKKEANEIINSLKICDPAVGSGHFLVSALNEIIAIKSELKILIDREGKTLRDYHVEVVNDELIVTDEDGQFVEYNPKNHESQRIQEALFHEKQAIIENCLFGVDINPNSVKICRLRLWIELLKNAYYRQGTEELETLPNIDINIKCGNSLISRYALDADIKKALKKSKWTIDSYRLAVMTYRNAKSKDEKQAMTELINKIKTDFESEIAANDKRVLRLNKLNGELVALTTQTSIFEKTKTEKAAWEKEVKSLTESIRKLEDELAEIKNNRIYENAFEWRFEFPEVLNEEGDFVGFDVVIGNPPYKLVDLNDFSELERNYYADNFKVLQYKPDLYHLFIEKSYYITKIFGYINLILPSTWMTQKFTVKLREFVLNNFQIRSVVHFDDLVFEEADVYTEIILMSKQKVNFEYQISFLRSIDSTNQITSFKEYKEKQGLFHKLDSFIIDVRSVTPVGKIISRIINSNPKLEEVARASLGCQAYNSSKHSKDQIENRVFHSELKLSEEYMEELAGSDVARYYIKKEKGKWIKYGPWLHDYRSIDWLTGPRILVREVTGKLPYQIQATYLEETYCNYKTILNVNPKLDIDFSMKLLCGYLNSCLLSFIFSNTSNKIQANTFPRISVGDLKALPIKMPDGILELEIAKKIDRNVSEILNLKMGDINFNTTSLEKEIDELVYELYGLTEEEIKIIEENFKF